ncbi:helix-turn-helix transcriptional regulator [Flavobacterium sp. ACN6]|uniref:helix-turn-helix transcriptional regulator n=1 Tax=Flavobacterium sp. ACN6 TaxID=1920426 RepID=UPI000BB34292|nr:helix-turn-helix transcriptional regulator [Flavobacterium sp. ACN6]PBJ04606.1 transcriptional activator FtrA [Flavobacterium sp. ACN6]
MKEVIHQFGVEMHWATAMAKAMDGWVEGNHIIVPSQVHIGTRYVLAVNRDITVMLADVTYNQDVHFKLRNSNNDFVGIYFNLTEGDSTHIAHNDKLPMGKWNYNLAIVDSCVDLDYIVKTGTKTYNICIFVKKMLLKEYLKSSGRFIAALNNIFDPEKNTIFHYNIMSSNSFQLINEFRKAVINPLYFDLFLTAVTYNLLGEYIDELVKKDIVIGKLNSSDFSNIIISQEFLISSIKDSFPGIKILSENACMSETKYKKLYKKITGLTPYEFYINNKLEAARDLLISGKYNIAEIANELNFPTASNLTQLFKQYFKVLPKDYKSQI